MTVPPAPIAPDSTASTDPFAGFWMGGFEGADHINGHGQALDLVRSSGHLDRLDEDHRRAAQAGLSAVRESIGWRLAEARGGAIDLGRARRIQASAERHGLQVLWTLMHYGTPEDLSLHDDTLIPRFARFAAQAVRELAPLSTRPLVITPVNEISFLAWAASHTGLLQDRPPHDGPVPGAESSAHSGYAVKRRLVRAALAGMQAMRDVDRRVRFLHVEPVVHVVAPCDRPDLAALAEQVRSWQWQTWDLLAGRQEPGLGGAMTWLDLIGLNHYHASQWEVQTEARLLWHERDPRRQPLGQLLAEAASRYGRPLILAETSHVGAGRADWLHDMAGELRAARAQGVPVLGLCAYPLVDRPDWMDLNAWHRSGVWHVDSAAAPATDTQATVQPAQRSARSARPLRRYAEIESLRALRDWQAVMPAERPLAACPASRPAQPPPHASLPAQPRHASPPVLLAFSHLRWDFLRHRGRHLLERLARPAQAGHAPWRVVFVEEPKPSDTVRLEHRVAGPHIDVLVPHAPGACGGYAGFGDAQQPLGRAGSCASADGGSQTGSQTGSHAGSRAGSPAGLHGQLQALLRPWLAAQGLQRVPVWLSTPMAWPLAQALQPGAVIYDCADELSGFSGAPPQLAALEAALLAAADRVWAAGPALAATRALAAGSRLRLLPNGVDPDFLRARAVPAGWPQHEVAQLLRRLPAAAPAPAPSGVRVGYAGAIDERLDLPLLAALADARPQWQIVMLGPVLKIDPRTLPQRPNLHWIGAQPYAVMAACVRSWQLALLPWRLSPATAQAEPLKLLEALAAGVPVAGTDLQALRAWADAGVQVAAGPSADDWVRACETALAQSPAIRARAQRRLRARTWPALARELDRDLRALVSR